MLKVRNLGNDFSTITGGYIRRGEIKELEEWEAALLIKLNYNIQLRMD